MNKLILFDIDGILVKSVSMGLTTSLLEKHFGIKPFETKVYMEGKTFRWIIKERLREAGITDVEKDPRFIAALDDVDPLLDSIKNKVIKIEVIPLVEDLIKLMLKRKYTIGLLTGNSLKSSKAKLEHVNLWKYFTIGAFGTDVETRSELVPIAIRDAQKKTGINFDKKDIYLIGDTIEDIKCAKDNGVNIIAVATGIEPIDHLKSQKPDFLFEDFNNPDAILSIIEKPK